MALTSHDVARLVGVSQPTVSRALRGDKRVSAATRLRVIEAAATLGYVPSEVGRSLSTRSTRQVAMVADLENPLYPRLVGPVHDALLRRGYRLLVLAERTESDTHTRLLDRSVDGAILTTSLLQSSLPLVLTRAALPVVQLNRVSDLVDVDSVTAANADGGSAVGELLLGLGHRRIAALLGPEDASSSRDRERGLRQRLADAGVSIPPRWTHHGTFTYDGGRNGMHAVLSGRSRPTAVFCVNDVVAVGALNAAAERGLRVPDDVTVVGFDDLDIASWPCFRLTTVHLDLDAMATRAADLLLDRIESEPSRAPSDGHASRTSTHEAFPTELVLRSTHAPAEKRRSRSS